MGAPFDLTPPGRIRFGPGTAAEAGGIVRSLGRRALVTTGAHPERARPLLDRLEAEGVSVAVFPVTGEPTVEAARAGTAAARAAEADVVVGFGGGSALDMAKAVAVLAANGGDPLDYLEVIGRGRPLDKPSWPVVAIPTTAGTGSEVTRNAVLASPEHGVKASLRNATMIPRAALVDPDLTLGLPPQVTASTGLDALTQLIEPYVSRRANPMTDAFCREGIPRAARSLRRAWADGSDRAAREDMALASLLGGLALAHAGLGIVHGVAGPAGGMLHAAHGALCAALLPHGMAANRSALKARQPDHPALTRYDDIARWLTGRADARAEDGEAWLRALNAELGIPSLADQGLAPEAITELARKTAAASSTKANPVELTGDDITALLQGALKG